MKRNSLHTVANRGEIACRANPAHTAPRLGYPQSVAVYSSADADNRPAVWLTQDSLCNGPGTSNQS